MGQENLGVAVLLESGQTLRDVLTGYITIGHVRYINILTWLRGFQVKLLYLVLFSLFPSLFENGETKEFTVLTRSKTVVLVTSIQYAGLHNFKKVNLNQCVKCSLPVSLIAQFKSTELYHRGHGFESRSGLNFFKF